MPASAAAAGTKAGGLAIGLVVVGLLCQEIGASVAVLLFPQTGPLGMVMLRLVFSAIILLAIARPALRGHSARAWRAALLLGGVLALMNGLFYLALTELPLGVTVTIEVLGPLALGGGGWDRLTLTGVLCALGAAASWAGYILASAQVGRKFAKLDGLALAMVFGAVISLPFGIADAGSALLRLDLLALGAAVAVLSSSIPYAMELMALRRVAPAVFGILMSLGPALAAVAGFVLLGQHLSPLEVAGIGLVVFASAGAVWAGRSRPQPVTQPVPLP